MLSVDIFRPGSFKVFFIYCRLLIYFIFCFEQQMEWFQCQYNDLI